MPAVPELADIPCQERGLEVVRELHPQNHGRSHRHARIAGEVEEHLQGIGEVAQPGVGGVLEVIVLVIVGYLLTGLFTIFERRFIFWVR